MLDEAAMLAAIDRVWKIEWRQDSDHVDSHLALMREYLRRSARAAEVLGRTGDWPWYDAAARLTLPDIDTRLLPGFTRLGTEAVPDAQWNPAEQKIMDMDSHIGAGPVMPSLYMRNSCLWYVRWESVKTHPALTALHLPDLYEPLLVLYERGGWFRMEHAYIDFGGTMIGKGRLQAHLESTLALSLDPQTLDQLDEAQKRREIQP